MNAESTIDEKGRILIPAEIRRLLKLKSGEKVIFQLEGNILKIQSATSPEEFSQKVKEFQQRLKRTTDEPVEFIKLFE
ncbi:MAG: AbrB/MazE/SpoVT family DNA-binding domain-containing protein [Candidatus Hodarchaeales archaeon]|jgi:AbrB family looped-hinge helix DNA binding protein